MDEIPCRHVGQIMLVNVSVSRKVRQRKERQIVVPNRAISLNVECLLTSRTTLICLTLNRINGSRTYNIFTLCNGCSLDIESLIKNMAENVPICF